MPRHDSRGSPARRQDVRRKAFRKRLKIGVFAVTALAVLGLAAFLVVLPLRAVRAPAPSATAPTGKVHQLVITMAGFAPPTVRVSAGRPFTLRLVNPDSQFHTDGGGWHQFRVETLGLDVRIPPRSVRSQSFAGLTPGRYEFYCNVCCGGKENPSMRGAVEVTG